MHLVLGLLLALASPSAAHSPSPAATLSPEMRSQTITGIEHALEGYFFVERIPRIKAALEANRTKLEAVADPHAFTKALNAVLSATTHDKHIHVHYSPDPLPDFSEHKETPAEIADDKMNAFMDYGYSSSARLPGNIGYLRLAFFPPDAAGMYDKAMALVSHTDALIIDLRDNNGGEPDSVDYLLGYFFKHPVEVSGFTWRENGKFTSERRYTAKVRGPFYSKPVYILTDDQTISGGEQFTYDMKSLHRARTIGLTTAGGANPGGPVRVNDHFAVFVPTGSPRNPYTKTNWEGVGIAPDVKAKDNDALLAGYKVALKALPSNQDRDMALQDPLMALNIALPVVTAAPDYP